MKIAIVVNELNIRGGTHKQILRLCQYLEKEKIEFVICTKYYSPQLTYPEFQSYKVAYLSSESEKFLDSKGSLKKKIINQKRIYKEQRALYELIPSDVDIVNVHDNGLEYVMFFAKKDGKKVVLQINDLPLYFRVGVNTDLTEKFSYKMHRYIYKRAIKRVDRITVNVTKNKEYVKTCLDRDAIVLYCGVDDNPRLKRHSKLHNAEVYHILSTGVFYPYRNYETLINVTEKLLQKGILVHLDIMGSVKTHENYANLIKNLIVDKKLEKSVTIWGQVDENRYVDLFDKADIFAFVNINQSWGLAVFEAMSCGLPTIVSNSVGAIELLQNDVDSIIVDPQNEDQIVSTIINLIENPEYYSRLSKKATDVVKKFTWDCLYCSKLYEIFKELQAEK